MKTEIDFLITKTPHGNTSYKAVSERAKDIQSKMVSINYTGWVLSAEISSVYPDFIYQEVPSSELPQQNT